MKYFIIYIAITALLSCNKPLKPKLDEVENISKMVVYHYDSDRNLQIDTITLASEELSSFIRILGKSQLTLETAPKVKDYTIKFDVKYTDNNLEHFYIRVYNGMNNAYITVSNDGKFMETDIGDYKNPELAIFITGYLRIIGIEI